MTLGETIVSLRSKKGWSQGDLADALDVSRQSVSKWETDASVPELEKLLKLADLFGVTLDALVRGEASPNEAPQDSPFTTPQQAPADFAAQSAPAAPRRHTTAGLVLLCTGAALVLLVLLLTGSLGGIIYAIPFLLCSVICFVSTGRRTTLWCTWALYLCADLFLRWATGLSWSAIKLTHLWTPEMNYVRLIVAWGQFLVMLAMVGATLFSYRRLRLEVTKKRLLCLALGWLLALALLPLLMRYLLMPLLYVSPYRIAAAAYSYLRLALITVLSVRTLTVFLSWRKMQRSAQ